MSNTGQYYDHTNFPQTGAPGSSASMRSELDSIEQGFNKLPDPTGNGGKLIKVSEAGTDLEASAVFSDDDTDGTVSGDLFVTGGQIGQNADQKHTIPAVANDTLALLAATQTLTNKTFNLSNNLFSGTLAQFNAALSDADFVSLNGAETLTNKTISAANNTITTAPSGNLSATTLNAALAELQGDIDTRATVTQLNDHITDATDAHAASAITNTPSGNLAATTVQAALNELQTDVDTRATTTALNAHLNDTDDAHDASAISYAGATGMSATNVEAAIDELAGDVITLDGAKVTKTGSTGSAVMPSGNTAQRDGAPIPGYLRFNAELNQFEGRHNTEWSQIGGGAKGGTGNPVVFENDKTVTASYTITSGKNALSAGPMTIADGVTLTIPDGSTYTIVGS
jgi:hypothetical protein